MKRNPEELPEGDLINTRISGQKVAESVIKAGGDQSLIKEIFGEALRPSELPFRLISVINSIDSAIRMAEVKREKKRVEELKNVRDNLKRE